MKLKIVFLCILSLLNIADAQTSNAKFLPSVNWQAQELEAKLTAKVEQNLNTLLSTDQYSVNVEVITKDAEEPQFYESQKKAKGKGQQDQENSIVNESKAAENKKLNEQLESKALIKFDDSKMLDESVEVVTLSKFGIQAPLVDDFDDFRPDGKIVLSMEGNGDSGKIDKIKEDFLKKEEGLKDELNKLRIENSISPIEQMWKYNDSIDIFKNLKDIKITISLASHLSSEIKETVQQNIKALNLSVGKVKAKINFETSTLGKIHTLSVFDKIKEFFKYFGPLSSGLFILASVVLLGLFASNLLNKYFEFAKGQSGGSQTLKMEGAQDDSSSSDGASAAGAAFEGDLADDVNGIERFSSLFETTPSEAVMLLKNWLSDTEEVENSLPLRALVQQLSNNLLANVFRSLTQNDRESWKAIIHDPLNENDIKKANKIISAAIVKRIIVPDMIQSIETYDLLLKMNPSTVRKVLKDHKEVSSVLLNVLNTNFLSSVLEDCSTEERENLFSEAMNLTKEDVLAKEDSLVEVLKKYSSVKQKYPFVDKLIDLLSGTGAGLEQEIYQKLASVLDDSKLKELAILNFPSFLLKDFSDIITKSFLSNYPLKDRVQYILVLEEAEKNRLMSIYAPEGSKAYDLMTMEFEQYTKDPKELEKLKIKTREICSDYTKYIRTQIRKDKSLMGEAEELIEQWLAKVQGKKADLKIVEAA